LPVTPWLERRLRLAVEAARVVPGAADDAAAARLAAALAEVPSPVLSRLMALADTVGDDAAAAVLEADAELVVWLARLMGDADG
jgi:hypothetical protein